MVISLGVVFAFLSCVQAVFAFSLASFTSNPIHRFPVAVLTIDAPWDNSIQRGPETATLLKDALEAEPAPSIKEMILSQGGSWRILQTPQMIQLGLFLPMGIPEAEAILGNLIDRLSSRLQNPLWQPRPVGLSDIIAGHLQTETSLHGKISLWLSPPLEQSKEAIGSHLQKLPPLPGNRDIARFSPEIVLANEPPTFIRLATWDHLDPCAMASARFFGERFAQLNNERIHWQYDVWAFPDKVALVLIATSSLDQLYRLPDLAESLQANVTAVGSGIEARAFLKNWLQVIEEDRSDLEKGAFLQAWENHVSTVPVDCASIGIRPPSRVESLITLPSSSQHRYLADSSGSPGIAAVRYPLTGSRAELAISIHSSPDLLETIESQFDRTDLALTRRPNVHRIEPDLLLIQTSVSIENLSAVVSILRNYLLSSTVPISGALGSTSRIIDPTIAASLDVTVLGIADLPPFQLLAKLREGWSQRTRPSPLHSQPLDLPQLAAALELASSTPRLMQGRWMMRSSTPGGMAQILAHLLARHNSFDGPDSIEALLGLSSLPNH